MDTTLVQLGDLGKDRITGFQGVATAVERWRNGNRKVQLTPRELKDGKPIECQIFDTNQIDVIERGVVPVMPVTYDGPIKLGDEAETDAHYVGIVEQERDSISGCRQFGLFAKRLDKKKYEHVRGVLAHSSEVSLVTSKVKELVASGFGDMPVGHIAY